MNKIIPALMAKKSLLAKTGLAVSLVAASAVLPEAMAAIDVSAATDKITTDGTAAVTAIGTAILGLAGVAVVFRWAKASIFG